MVKFFDLKAVMPFQKQPQIPWQNMWIDPNC
jgi:hypothetical protein